MVALVAELWRLVDPVQTHQKLAEQQDDKCAAIGLGAIRGWGQRHSAIGSHKNPRAIQSLRDVARSLKRNLTDGVILGVECA